MVHMFSMLVSYQYSISLSCLDESRMEWENSPDVSASFTPLMFALVSCFGKYILRLSKLPCPGTRGGQQPMSE